MLGSGDQKKTRTFGKRGGLTPVVPRSEAAGQRPPYSASSQGEVPPSLDIFSTSDPDLARYLTAKAEPTSLRGQSDRAFESRNSGISELLARPSAERAELFVLVSDMLKAHETLRGTSFETFKKLVPMSSKARTLQAALLRQDYALEDLQMMSVHFDFILGNPAGIQKFDEAVFSAHAQQPTATSIALLELLCGEKSQRHFLQGRKYRAEFLRIEKAHEALGHPPGSHPLSQLAAQEDLTFKAELDRIAAQADPVLAPYARFLNDTRETDPTERMKRQADKDLLLEDLQDQALDVKGTAFLSALELSRMASNSPLAKDGPKAGRDNVPHAALLASFPRSMKLLALTLSKKKLVFSPEAALELLRICAVSKLDLGQDYKALPPQFWKSLGNALPKNDPAVRQILASATALKEKQKHALLIMSGLSSEEGLRDEVADKYRRMLEDAQGVMSLSLDNLNHSAPPSGSKTGILGRLFRATPKAAPDRDPQLVSRLAWRVGEPLRRLAEALPPACYFDLDTSVSKDLLAQAKERIGAILEQHGLHADVETVEEAQDLAQSLDQSSTTRLTADNLVSILSLERILVGFRQFSPAERETLGALALSLHPLPKSGKPSTKWLDSVAVSPGDEILDKLLTAIGPDSSPNDDIIVAAVHATARMPGVATQTLERLVNSGFEDAPHGKRHERLANAALWVLSQRRGDSAVAAMRRIAETCRWITGRDLAAKYLKTMVRGDADDPVLSGELLLPALKIWPEPYREPLAGGHAVFQYDAPDRLSLTWETTDGKTAANPSAQMKSDDPAGIKRLKKLVPQLERTLQAHIRWIERLFLSASSFRFDEWQERYLEHETRGALTRYLIWRAQTEDGITFSFLPTKGGFQDSSGNDVDPSACLISLWHPVDEPEGVDEWRAYLVEQSLVQPFAQAFRSTYEAENFDQALDMFARARIKTGWRNDIGRLAESYGWTLSSKPSARKKTDTTLYLFDPVSRLYIATGLTPKSIHGHIVEWYETAPISLARAELGASPTKAGLKKAKPLAPSNLTAVQHSEVVRSLFGLLSEALKNPADTPLNASFPEVPFVRPMSEERARAIGAYASRLADPRAAKTWLGKLEGEDRISVQEKGRLRINGVKDRYIFCPFENRVWGADGLTSWTCSPSDSQIEGASHVPFGLDPLLRRMTASVQLLSKDDRPGNGRLTKGRY